MPRADSVDPFTPLFDRSVELCARAQALLRQSASAIARARRLRSLRRKRPLVAAGRMNLEVAEILFTSLRDEVETAAFAMRDAGLDVTEAEATVRSRVRFVLYDGGFREVEAEPVVERATTWVKAFYEAA